MKGGHLQRRITGRWKPAAVVLALVVAMVAVAVLTAGAGEPGARGAVRMTARVSAVLVLGVFVAYGRIQSWAWLRENRAALLLALAVSHTGHLGAIVWLDVVSPERPLRQGGAALLGGMLAYAFLAALALAVLRDRPIGRWGTFAMYYFYLIFVSTYVGQVLQLHHWQLAPLAVALLAGLAIRVSGSVKYALKSKRWPASSS